MGDDKALEPKTWLYRGHELNVYTVIEQIQKKLDTEISEVHGRFVGLYLREGPRGYAKQKEVYAHYAEYRLIRGLMAELLLSLKAIRGESRWTEKYRQCYSS